MARIRLIHWNEKEAAERAVTLRRAGHEVEAGPVDPAGLRALRAKPPAAFVIDLSRLPSHGREVALALRMGKATRSVPIVVVGGEAEKVERLRALLPDASYCQWGRIRTALERAIAHPPASPVVPGSGLAGYSGTPLPKKLGIKPGAVVALLDAPEGFERTLEPLPEGAVLRRDPRGARDLTLCFCRGRARLQKRIAALAPLGAGGGLWLIWPKKTSALAGDLGETEVRRIGLAAGLVDFKVCAVDADWSGLRFSLRST